MNENLDTASATETATSAVLAKTLLESMYAVATLDVSHRPLSLTKMGYWSGDTEMELVFHPLDHFAQVEMMYTTSKPTTIADLEMDDVSYFEFLDRTDKAVFDRYMKAQNIKVATKVFGK